MLCLRNVAVCRTLGTQVCAMPKERSYVLCHRNVAVSCLRNVAMCYAVET